MNIYDVYKRIYIWGNTHIHTHTHTHTHTHAIAVKLF